MREARAEVIEFARAQGASFWELRPRGADGWTNKDLLAHIGGGNDQMLQLILRAVIAQEPVDASVTTMDTNTENARAVEERRDWTVGQVIAELESTRDEMQSLLGGLRDTDKGRMLEGLNITLEQLMAVVMAEDHDREHLTQLRATLEREG
jgi:hypothetical protein